MKQFWYATRVTWTGERKGTAEIEGKPPLPVAAPPEFKGHPGMWTPEDLFVSAIESCLMLTYVSLCQGEAIELVSYSSHARALLEKGANGMAFSRVEISPHVEVKNNAARAEALMTRAKQLCMVGRSVSCDVLVIAQVRQLETA